MEEESFVGAKEGSLDDEGACDGLSDGCSEGLNGLGKRNSCEGVIKTILYKFLPETGRVRW